MIEVKIFGSDPPCAKCKKAEEAARKAAEAYPGQVSVEKLSALSPEGLRLGILSTPVVAVDGKIVARGSVPDVKELRTKYADALGA